MEKERIENEKELRDKVYYPSLDLQKISKQIKLILANEYKFNQLEIHEQFFESFTNRINFLFDNFKPPYIKNNLIKIKYDKNNYENNYFEWKWMNALGINALNYISHAKIKIQRENDERKEFLLHGLPLSWQKVSRWRRSVGRTQSGHSPAIGTRL
jgi:hypothetical protein